MRTIEDDFLRGTYFEDNAHLKEDISQYLYYYNEERPYQCLSGVTSNKFKQNCPRITQPIEFRT